MEETLQATAPTFDGTQLCTKIDPETFFPELPEKPTGQDKRAFNLAINKAKAICNSCVFVNACLEYAITTSVVGVWGGTTERERNNIRRSRKIKAPETITALTNSWTTPSKKRRGTP